MFHHWEHSLLTSIWRYISFISQTIPTGFRRKRTRALKRPCRKFWSCMDHVIQGNSIAFGSTVKHDSYFRCRLIHPHDRKSGKYQTLFGSRSSEGIFRKYPFSTQAWMVALYSSAARLSFFKFLSVLRRRDKAIGLVSGSSGLSTFQGTATRYLTFSYSRESFTLFKASLSYSVSTSLIF